MHLGLASLLGFYHDLREDDALVLGTVIATQGSTYRKAGAMMLVAADGSHCGLISGGCLEADLALQAEQVFATGKTRSVRYDLAAGDELVWGLGIGCDGAIELMLQRLDHPDYGFFSVLEQAWQARQKGVLALVIASTDRDCPRGSFSLDCGVDFRAGEPELSHNTDVIAQPHDMSRHFRIEHTTTRRGDIDMLLIPLRPPPALLICGAGIDAVPVARLAVEMGWDCTLVDHRSGFARAERFPAACKVHLLQTAELGNHVKLEAIDAVIMMSHNLAHDRQYLSQVIDTDMAYIGLLGPRARRDRLLSELGTAADERRVQLAGRHIHGPAGLDIGAELPTSIALAIIAEIHACLNQRSGGELTPVGA